MSKRVRTNRLTAVLVGASVMGLVLAGCSGTGSGESGGDGPIRLGSLMSLSGSAEAFGPLALDTTLQAFAESVNADGGINGRDLEITVVDDGGTPSGAAQGARKLVEEGVVAFVGGTSYASCAANAQYYAQEGIVAVEGIGVLPECTTSENIATVTPGPIVEDKLSYTFAVEELGLTKPCLLKEASPASTGMNAAVQEAVERTGVEPAYEDWNIPATQTDYTPLLIQAKEAGCESIKIGGGPQESVAVAEQMRAQGMDDVVLMMSGASYDAGIGEMLAEFPNPMYAGSELETFDSDAEDMVAYQEFIAEHELPQSAFTLATYLAASTVVEVLRGMDGEITAETVAEALTSTDPIESDLTGEPFVFGEVNESIKMTKLEGGAWVSATPEFILWD